MYVRYKETHEEDSVLHPETTQQYSTVNRSIITEMIKAKEEWISEQCDNIAKGMKEGNCKKAFDTLKKLSIKQQHSLLTDNAAVLTRWTEYCISIY